MNPLANAAIKAGLIPEDALAEVKRWRTPVEIPDEVPEPPKTIEEAAEKISRVLESEGYVLTRETDLEVLHQYLTTQESGDLSVAIIGDGLEEPQRATFEVSVGRTRFGEYIIPYRGDSLHDAMTNGFTHLILHGERLFFGNVREVFFGEHKAFMVCTVSRTEKHDG